MRERLSEMERQIENLTARLDRLADRFEATLARSSRNTPPVAAVAPPEISEPAPRDGAEADDDWSISGDFERLIARHGLVFLAGFVSLALAGALVLRQVTMSSPVSVSAGAALGVAYCAFLLFVAERKFRAGKGLFGDTFALLAVMILDILLVDATLRAGGFGHPFSFAVLAGSVLTLGWLAIRRSRVVPFTVGLLAAPAVGLAIGGKPFLHPYFAGVLVVCLLVAEQGRRKRGWTRARWGPGIAILLYLTILGLLGWFAARSDLPAHLYAEPRWALPILAAFFLLISLPTTLAAVLRKTPLDGWEITMGVATAALVLLGSTFVLTGSPAGHVTAGVAALALSLFYYLASAKSFTRHGAESGSFYALAAIAFVHALVAFPVLLGATAIQAFAWQALALVLAFFAARLGKKSLSFQAHVLTVLAFATFFFVEIRLSPGKAGSVAGSLWMMAAGALAILSFERLRSFVPEGRGFHLSRLRPGAVALAGVLAAGVLEILAGLPHLLFPVVRAIPGVATGAAGEIAAWKTLLTILLTTGGVGILALGIRLRQVEAALLAVGLTGLAGVKLALDSLKVPGPYAAVAAAYFGLALLLSSVLYRRGRGLDTLDRKGDS